MIPKQRAQPPIDDGLIRIQTREVYYSPEKLVRELCYHPILTYEQELESLRKWLQFANAI